MMDMCEECEVKEKEKKLGRWSNFTNDELLQMLIDFSKKINKSPNVKEMTSKNKVPSSETYFKRFNTRSWNDILEMCNLTVNVEKYTREEGVKSIIAFYNLLGKLPTQEDFSKYIWRPCFSWYNRSFGEIENVFYEANLIEKPLTIEERKQETIKEIKEVAEILNKLPTQEEYNSYRKKGLPITSLIKLFEMNYTDFIYKVLPIEKYLPKDGFKKCPKCGEIKPLNEFNSSGEKHASWCKVCYAVRRNKKHNVTDNWSNEEYILILDNIINNKIDCLNDLIEKLNNKNLDELVEFLNTNRINGINKNIRIRTMCDNCGKIYTITLSSYKKGNKYCSKECASIGLRNGEFIECDFCGKEIYITQGDRNNFKNHFCSRKCRASFVKETKKEVRYCSECGESFVTIPSSPVRFCSVPCARKYISENYVRERTVINVKCDWCNRDLEIGNYEDKTHRHHFCNAECRTNWFKNIYSKTEEFSERSRLIALNNLANGVFGTDTSIQKLVNNILNELNVKYENEKIYDFYAVDNYLNDLNLIIEVNGDYFHANPNAYNEIAYDSQLNRIYSDRTKNTHLKKKYGINILYLWEDDINNNFNLCKELMLLYINNKGKLKNYESFNYEMDKDNNIKLKSKIIKPYRNYKKDELEAIITIGLKQERKERLRDESKWMQCECDTCKKTIEMTILNYEQTKNHFCSKECYDTYQTKATMVKCSNCENEVRVIPSRLAKNKNIFCCKECEMEFKRNNPTRKRIKGNCDWCGNEYEKKVSDFNKTKNHYCCDECRILAKKSKKDKLIKCSNCGKDFYKIESKIQSSNHHFCCKDCEYEYRRKNPKIDKKITCKCDNCGIPIFKKKSEFEGRKNHFCSIKCASEYKTKTQTVVTTCENCGKEKIISNYKYKNAQHHFCCYECSVEYKRNNKNLE